MALVDPVKGLFHPYIEDHCPIGRDLPRKSVRVY